MTDDDHEVLHAEEISSFQGMIYMLKAGREIPLRLSRSSDKFTWTTIEHDDWLQAGGSKRPPLLNFEFHSQTPDRLHFSISGTGQDAKKKLGASRNGYLGLYEHAEVTNFWKIEPLEWVEQGLICRWRDHLGHQVKAELDNPHHESGTFYFMTTGEGELHEFLIKRVN